ncbi:MAG TPA: NAD(P)H-hydrate dehydratase [Candidatus Acidoferrum sp.]|nr:NAD(P)H-hydrate dehydratase [Candidatus Acidoferrum sp.]HVS74020.1 NAD(P)H-hydrate dehydratase [Candidatus Acidoferrales bacterium]
MKALTAAEMREVDRLTTERFGIPSLQLMEAAGRHTAEAVLGEFAPEIPSRVVVLCAKGNNGGDGFVAARYLKAAGAAVRLFLFGGPDQVRGDAAENLRRWQEAGGGVSVVKDTAAWEAAWPDVAGAEVIVDALLGTGLRGPAEGLIAQAIGDVNRLSGDATAPTPRLVLAVDTPSGLPSDGGPAEGPVLRAHQTVTFTAPKIGQLLAAGAAAVGALRVCQIGSPAGVVEEVGQSNIRLAEPLEFAALPLVRAADAHKGSFGHVLLVCGSLGKSGAAVLAGRGALRAGAGLVTVAAPDVVLPGVAAAQAEYMTEPLASTEAGTASLASLSYGRFSRLEEGKSVLGIGPGLGTHQETQQLIRTVVRDTRLPVVLDADGLNAFVGRSEELCGSEVRPIAITPHPGEMARLLGTSSDAVQSNRLRAAQEAARRWNAVVILKGFHTLVAAPGGTVFVNASGNAGLAKGGSGDTLTGVLAALTAQFGTRDWARVLALGVYLHGRAAELAARGTDPSGLLAGEVSDALPAARHELLRELQRRG